MHILMMNNAVVMYVCQGMNLSIENHLKRRHTGRKYTGDGIVLYVQEVVVLQKKIFNIFVPENEVYTIY